MLGARVVLGYLQCGLDLCFVFSDRHDIRAQLRFAALSKSIHNFAGESLLWACGGSANQLRVSPVRDRHHVIAPTRSASRPSIACRYEYERRTAAFMHGFMSTMM
jgi:hypothetical protein